MTSKRETQTAFMLMQDVCGTIPRKDEDSIKDVWKKGVDIGIERANKQVEEIAKETAKANEVCRKASNDIESLESSGPNRLTEFETELQIAEQKCGNLKSQLDYMRSLYQVDKKETPSVQHVSEPSKKDRHKRHREKHSPPEEEEAPPTEPIVKSFLDEPISRLMMNFREPSEESPFSETILPKKSESRCRLDDDLFSPLGSSEQSLRECKLKKANSVKGKRKKREKEVRREPSPDVGGFKIILSPREKSEQDKFQPPSEGRALASRTTGGRAAMPRHRPPSKAYSNLRKEELKSEEVIHDILNGMTRSVFEINELNQTITKDHEKEVQKLKREKTEHRKQQEVSTTTGTESTSPRRDQPFNVKKKDKLRQRKHSKGRSIKAKESRNSMQRMEDTFNEMKEKVMKARKDGSSITIEGSSTAIDTSPTRFVEEVPNNVTSTSCNPFSTSSSHITVNQIYDHSFQRVYADDNLKRKSAKGKAPCVRRGNPCDLTSSYPAGSEVSVPCSTKRKSRVRRDEPKRQNKALGPFTQLTRAPKKEAPPVVRREALAVARREASAVARREVSAVARKEASEETTQPRKKKLIKAHERTSKSTLSGRRRTGSNVPQLPPSRDAQRPDSRAQRPDSHSKRPAPPLLELYHNEAATLDTSPSDVHVASRHEKQPPASHDQPLVEVEEEDEEEEEEVERNVREISVREVRRQPVSTRLWETRSTKPAPPSETRDTVTTEPCFRRSHRNQPYPLRNAPVVPVAAVSSITPRYGGPIRSYPPVISSLGNHRYELPTLSSQLKKTGKSYFSHFNFRRIPFTVGTSTTPTHNIGLNMQQCLSIMKLKHTTGISLMSVGEDLLKESQHSDVMRPISAFISRMSSKAPCPVPRDADYPEQQDCGDDMNTVRRKLSATSFKSRIYVETNILGQPSKGEYIRVHRGDEWSNSNLNCNGADYKKMFEASDRLAARKGAVDRRGGSSYNKEQEEFFSTLQGRVRGLKQVLNNLQDEFKQLNAKYNELCEATDPSCDAEKSSEIRELEVQLQAKENEIQVVLGLFKEVITLKSQVSTLKDNVSASSFAPTMAPSNYGYNRPLKMTSDQSTVTVRLTKVLRTIQNFQHELKQGPPLRSIKNC